MTATAKPASPDEIFRALGHPARLNMVRALQRGEHCVCDLVKTVGLGWSTTSRHLNILRRVGIVASDKRGQQVFYHLKLACVAEFVACLEAAQTRRPAKRAACPIKAPRR